MTKDVPWAVVVREERDGANKVLDSRFIGVESPTERAIPDATFLDDQEFDAPGINALASIAGDNFSELGLDAIAMAGFELGRRFEREHPGEEFTPKT